MPLMSGRLISSGKRPVTIYAVGAYTRSPATQVPNRPICYRLQPGYANWELMYIGAELPAGNSTVAPAVSFTSGCRNPNAPAGELFAGVRYIQPSGDGSGDNSAFRENRYVAARSIDGGATWSLIQTETKSIKFLIGLPPQTVILGLDPFNLNDTLPYPVPDSSGTLDANPHHGDRLHVTPTTGVQAMYSPAAGVVCAFGLKWFKGTSGLHGTGHDADGYYQKFGLFTSSNGGQFSFGGGYGPVDFAGGPFGPTLPTKDFSITNIVRAGKTGLIAVPGLRQGASGLPYDPLYSSDGGASWSTISAPLDRAEAAAYDDSCKFMILDGMAGTNRQIYSSPDLGTWTQRYDAASGTPVSVAARGGRWLASNLGLTTDFGASWSGTVPDSGLVVANGRFYGIDAFGPSDFYRRPTVSTNQGQSFSPINLPLPADIHMVNPTTPALRITQIFT